MCSVGAGKGRDGQKEVSSSLNRGMRLGAHGPASQTQGWSTECRNRENSDGGKDSESTIATN